VTAIGPIGSCLGMSMLTLLAAGVTSAAAAPAQSQPAAKPHAVDPAAVAALTRMGHFLREQKNMQIKGDTITDEVLDSGQKVQSAASIDVKVRRPDRLRVDTEADRKSRRFFYDGKSFAVYSPKAGYYAQVAAPPTIREMIEDVASRYGIEMPLADLFFWGTDKSGVEDIRAAVDLGPSTIAGVKCEQYAFHQSDVDWQIWIQAGDQPLPRKFVVTTLADEARPQYQVVLTWKLNATFDDKEFAFVPPKEAMPIAFEDLAAHARSRQGRSARTSHGGKK
jgi:hypothetical protein